MQPNQLTLDPAGAPAAARPSLGRLMLAVLIACALFLSFFHGWSPVGDADAALLTSPIVTTDTALNAPPQHAPAHSDHCLTHLVSQPWQAPAVVPAQFGGTVYLFNAEAVPAGLDGVSPFKPPCV